MARKIKIKKSKIKKSTKSEMETVNHMLLHLEDEYRKANISDKGYEELREKYLHKLERLKVSGSDTELGIVTDGGKEKEKKKKGGFLKGLLGKKDAEPKKEEKKQEKKEKKKEEPKEKRLEPGEIEEVTPEVIQKLAEQMAGDSGVSADDVETDEDVEQLKEPEEAAAEGGGGLSAEAENKLRVELEKLKVMIETMRESKHVTDETIQTISETIGEMRSMIFQTDASLKESLAKMERLEDEVADVRPQQLSKTLREMNDTFEKINLEIEKMQTKTTGQGERLNEVIEIMKSLGGIENLLQLNKKIQEKLKDVKEAETYIERIGNKIEKIYIDLNRGVEDIVLIRAKQEDFENGLKDIVKSLDNINVKFGNYITKGDMDEFKKEMLLITKQLQELNKVIPIAELKVPEKLLNLRKEREDVKILLEAVEEQFKNKEITKEEYESLRNGSMKKLNSLGEKLKEEWERFEKTVKTQKSEATQPAPATPQPAENVPEESKEEKPEEKSEETEVEETKEEEEPEEEPEEEAKPEEESEKKPKKKGKKKKEKVEKKEGADSGTGPLEKEFSKAGLNDLEKKAVMKQIKAGNIKTSQQLKKEIGLVKSLRKQKTKPLVKKKKVKAKPKPKKKAKPKKKVKKVVKAKKKVRPKKAPKRKKKAKAKKKAIPKRKVKKRATDAQRKKKILSGLIR